MTTAYPESTSPSLPDSAAGAREQAEPTAARPTTEWLETDGLGGYAASTPALCPTRRYHGLLVAPAPGTPERHVYLGRFDERLIEADGPVRPFSVARYPGVLAPRGDLALESFEHEPAPRAVYRLGQARIAREVRMLHGSHAVLVRYELLESDGPCALELRPILPCRRADHLTVENDAADTGFEPLSAGAGAWGVSLQPYASLPRLCLVSSVEPEAEAEAVWYRDLVFSDDRARGYEGREDELSPLRLSFVLEAGESVVLAASLEQPVEDPERAFTREGRRRQRAAGKLEGVAARLDRAADAFLYTARTDAGERIGIVAGYPWFLEWGRDTFLSLPGLTLARGRLDTCGEVLHGALPFLRNGLFPNVFGTSPETSHYGSADAALWFARAVLLYDRAGGKRGLLQRELLPALESIAEACFEGTDLGVGVDDEGLLVAGAPDLNPTWMDARTSQGPVTPRHGTPVELAALWCSLLAHLEELSRSKVARRARSEQKKRARRAFLERFWIEETGYLADVWREGTRDTAVRPNAVLAASLELAPLTKAQRARVVERAGAALLTPRGLRTLAPDERGYRGRFRGGPEERDAAYHQGTVWPWLLGAYTEASLRAGRPTRARLAALSALWEGLEPELDRAGLDHLSEVFDGDPPHAPGGSFAQAWNTAEWLRARRMLADGHA